MSRPIKWTVEKKEIAVKEILLEIMKGRSLTAILKTEERGNLPSKVTFFEWLKEDEELTNQYARATEVRADIIFDDILAIADENTNDTSINENGIEVVNNDVIQRSRLRIDARKWVLSKLNPKKFGDKTIHSGDADNPIQTTFSILNIDPLSDESNDSTA